MLLGASHDRDWLNSVIYPRSEAVGIRRGYSRVVPKVFYGVDKVRVVLEEKKEDVGIVTVETLDWYEVGGFAGF